MHNADFADRLRRLSVQLQASDIDFALVSPGPDLRYLSGYDAVPLERITALIVGADGSARLVAPHLEKAAAEASPIGGLGIEISTWQETQDPYALIRALVGNPGRVAVDARMWAEKLLRIQAALPDADAVSAGPAISALRRVKSTAEIESLRSAGAAIDSVHAQVHKWLKPGRTEREIGRDISAAIIEAGHVRVDFVIVGSGPNSASPHHEVSDRVVQSGEPVVVDIGGTMPDGYCSDSTRTYYMGAPSADFARDYAALQESQAAATRAVAPGVPCEEIDAVARRVLTDAGLGDLFIHRVGHGIGMETHEEPYMVTGNSLPLESGVAFSIEPGFYRNGVAGARIEDIVVCGQSGADVLNLRPRELIVL